MGGTTQLLLPVGERRTSGWSAHQRRNPPSSEPGTDWYCPIGTPVIAPADGRIYGYENTIEPATGRWIGIEFDNGMSFRAMHFSRLSLSSTLLNNRGRVAAGTTIALSGASGYGEEDWSWNPNTGGAHVHGTLWPNHDRRFGYRWVDGVKVPYTIDFMSFAVAAPAGGSTTPSSETDTHMDIFRCDNIDGNGKPGVGVLNDAAPLRNPSSAWPGMANPLIITDATSGSGPQVKKWERILRKTTLTVTRDEWETRMELVRATQGFAG